MPRFQLADPILTIGEVQDILRIKSRATIMKLIKTGKLRSLPRTPGVQTKFLASEVQRYVDSMAAEMYTDSPEAA